MYVDMAKQRKALDKDLAASITEINDSIAKQAALADSRFSKTVKNIAAARKEASDQVKQARKDFATGLASATASIKDMETKLVGNVELISAEVISHKAAQARVNRHTNAELKRINKLMNHQYSVSAKARGKLRAILDENKRAKVRKQAKDNAASAAKDLSEATEAMYDKPARIQREQLYMNKEANAKIQNYSAQQLADIKATEEEFTSRLTSLT